MAAPRRSLLLVWAALAAGGQAAETPPPVGKAGEESIASAKREFDALKNARTAGEPQSVDLSGVRAPTLHLTDEDMAAFLQEQAAQKKKDKAAKAGKRDNWLVDAMAEKKPADQDELKMGGTTERGSGSTLNLVQDLAGPSRNELATTTAATKPPTGADNPLTQFMAGWMTPKDFDLLKIKPADENLGISPEQGLDRAAIPGGSSVPRSDGLTGMGRSAGSGAGTDPRPNPYLADFGALPGTELKDALSLPAPPVSGYAPPPPLAPVSKPEIAPVRRDPPQGETLKPSTDAKYFPQLKRF